MPPTLPGGARAPSDPEPTQPTSSDAAAAPSLPPAALGSPTLSREDPATDSWQTSPPPPVDEWATRPPIQATPGYSDTQPLSGPTTGGAAPPALPGYEILGELGHGGMGVVYKAMDRKLKRLVALKMLLSGARAGRTELARFRSEAEAVARLQHPNIVQIYEIGEDNGCPFLSLEFVADGSLERRLADHGSRSAT